MYERKNAGDPGDNVPGVAEIKSLLEKQDQAFDEFKAANDARLKSIEEKGWAPADLTEKVEKINGDLTKLSKEIGDIAKKANRPAAAGGGEGTPEQAEHKSAWLKYARKGHTEGLREIEQKALRVGSDPDGGYFVPAEMEAGIDRILAQEIAMFRLGRVVNITGGSYKKVVNKGGAAFGGWAGETDGPSETGTPNLAELEFTPGTAWAEPHATKELLEDASINLESWLADEVGITFGETIGGAYIDGDGVKKPRGFLAYPTVLNSSYAWGKIGHIKSGNASAFDGTNPGDAFIDLIHSLRRGYRNNGVWLMNDLTVAEVRKFKDGQGNYLWSPSVQVGQPERLLGYPIEVDDNMPDVAANAFPIAFADWMRSYLIVNRRGVSVLRDEYTRKPYVKFYTTRRVGGGIQNFEAIKLMKIAA